MISKKISPILKKIFLFLSILIFIQACGSWDPPDVKDSPINDADMRKRNIEEGRGVNLGLGKKRSGSFDFATSNEMWRAALEILDFVPLATADYGGGIIITDWYSDDLNSNESIKIMINFLSNEIRADGLKIKVYKKVCTNNAKCNTKMMQSSLENEIKLAVLKKAAQIKKSDGKKRAKDEDYTVVPSKE
tara:strand:- start:16 stop:585 length:570 start_codon:yes stop_codon:yes gene_type:complete